MDDSGLIDLKALMEASRATERAPARSAELTPVPVVRNIDLYPFGAPTPPEPAPAPAPQEKPRARPAVRVILPVLGAVALAGALALVLLSGGPREGQPPAAAAVPGDHAPTHEAAMLPMPPPAAEPAPSASGSVAKPPVTTSRPVKPAPVKPTPVRPTPVKPTPVKPTPVKPPAPSPCNGDLRCEMERAVHSK